MVDYCREREEILREILIIFSGGGGGGGGYIINFIEVCHNEWMNEFCWEDTLSFFFLYFWAVDWRRSSRVGRLHRFWRWFEYLERKKFWEKSFCMFSPG